MTSLLWESPCRCVVPRRRLRPHICLLPPSLPPPSGLSSLWEDVEPQLYERAQQHGPQRDAHQRQLDVRQLLQLGAQGQAEAQFEQHGREVPGTQAQVRGAVARVVAGLAAARHLDGQHDDEDAVEDPHGEEDEEPVPLHLRKKHGCY